MSPTWEDFARANDAPELAPERVVDSSLWDWVSGAEVQHVYRGLLARLRAEPRTLRVPFRCDRPALRRFMELALSAVPDGGVRCDARLLRAEPRAPVPLLEAGLERGETFLGMCSWCKRVRSGGGWLELEEAVTAFDLLGDAPPWFTHTICDACEAPVGAQLAEPGAPS